MNWEFSYDNRLCGAQESTIVPWSSTFLYGSIEQYYELGFGQYWNCQQEQDHFWEWSRSDAPEWVLRVLPGIGYISLPCYSISAPLILMMVWLSKRLTRSNRSLVSWLSTPRPENWWLLSTANWLMNSSLNSVRLKHFSYLVFFSDSISPPWTLPTLHPAHGLPDRSSAQWSERLLGQSSLQFLWLTSSFFILSECFWACVDEETLVDSLSLSAPSLFRHDLKLSSPLCRTYFCYCPRRASQIDCIPNLQ